MTEAAQLQGQRQQLAQHRVLGVLRRRQMALEHGLVVGDILALPAPLGGVAEYIPDRAAQTLQRRQQAKCPEHPGAELPFRGHAGVRIAPAEQRRRQIEAQAVVTFKLLLERLRERRVAVQASDFVLILVGHQFVQRPGRRCGEGVLGLRLWIAGAHPGHTLAKAPRVGFVLILEQAAGAILDQCVRGQRGQAFGARQQREHPARVVGIAPAVQKSPLVEIDGHGVEFDRPLQSRGRHRHQTALPGVAEQKQIAGDGIPQQGGGDARRIQEMAALTHLRAHPLLHRRGGKRRVGVQNKTRRGDLCVVDHRLRAPVRDLAHGLVGRGHHEIATEQQVRFPGGDTHRENVVLAPPDAHMRDHRAELLGQPGLIHGGTAFALNVRGHGDQRRDGQHTGAADAGHHRIPGPGVDIRQGRLGQGIKHHLTRVHRPGPTQSAADDGDEARAESAIATVVLVARALIDAALATQRRF